MARLEINAGAPQSPIKMTAASVNLQIRKAFEEIAEHMAGVSEQMKIVGNLMESGEPGTVKKKKRTAAIKDPNAPKKPLTSYFIFSMQMRDTVKKQMPNATSNEIASALGQIWRDMSPEEKKDFVQQHQENVKVYEAQMKDYEQKKETEVASSQASPQTVSPIKKMDIENQKVEKSDSSSSDDVAAVSAKSDEPVIISSQEAKKRKKENKDGSPRKKKKKSRKAKLVNDSIAK